MADFRGHGISPLFQGFGRYRKAVALVPDARHTKKYFLYSKEY
jgi:hypothetical protein